MKYQNAKRAGFKAAPKPHSPTAPSVAVSAREITHDEISAHAQAIWEEQGRPQFKDEEIWLSAERELRSLPAGRRPRDNSGTVVDDGEEGANKLADRLAEFGEPSGRRSATSL